MNPDRWDRILASVRQRTTPGPLVAHLCTVARGVIRADHVSICIDTDHGLTPLGGSDALAIAADEMQNLWGLGPSVAAATSTANAHAEIITVPDLAAEVDERWPLLGALTDELGIRSLSATPLRTGGAHLGVLTGYSHQPRTMGSEQLADALVLATIVTEVLLGLRAIDTSLEGSSDGPPDILVELLATLPQTSLHIHQAAGIIAEHLHISILEAQIRLRALAFRRGDTLENLSRRITTDLRIPDLED